MRYSVILGFFAIAGFCFGTAKAENLSNGWQNIAEKTDLGMVCILETKGLPFTFALYRAGNVSSMRLTNPSGGIGMDVTPQITLKIGHYQKDFVFTLHHLSEMKAIIPADEMVEIETALGDAKSASFAFHGLAPNRFSLKGIGNKLSDFRNCAWNIIQKRHWHAEGQHHIPEAG